MKKNSGHRSNAICIYKVTPDATRCENCKIIQGQTRKSEVSVSKPPYSESYGDVFEKEQKQICTPLKRYNETLYATDLFGVCDFIQKMSKSKRYKCIKVNIEFIESD